jgi:hypothetical protein
MLKVMGFMSPEVKPGNGLSDARFPEVSLLHIGVESCIDHQLAQKHFCYFALG